MTIGDGAAHNAGHLVKIRLVVKTVTRRQFLLDFGTQLHQLQNIYHVLFSYGASAMAFILSRASLKRLVRASRFSILACAVPNGA